MKVVTALQMREIDRATIEEIGFPALGLMLLAGKAVADHIINRIPRIERVAIFAGTGNNGGDGFAAAYYLMNRKIHADVYLTGDPDKLSDISRIYYNLCKNSGIRVLPISNNDDIDGIDLEGYGLIVDAMLGTGFTGKLKGVVSDLIPKINDSDTSVLAIDIPSGLESDGSAPTEEAINADCTITIGLPKISLVTYPGKSYSGTLHIADIGFPKTLTESENLTSDLLDPGFFAKNAIYEIESEYSSAHDTHKAERGHLLLLGGFDGMEGAIMMTAQAALETGVGLATLLTTGSSRAVIAGRIPELITVELPEAPSAASHPALKKILGAMFESRRYAALVIGPGMGRTTFAKSVFDAVIGNISEFGVKRVLIDGDGLFHLAGFLEKGRLDERVEFIITPHFMEASRLAGISVDTIRKNRYAAAGILARRHSCITLLKGPATIVSDGDRFIINTTGSSALATAGSGDVLSGIIGSLLLRKFSCLHAAAFGAYIHGKAADHHCRENRTDTLKATDILPYIRAAKKFST